ncbi:beta-phosphoglucomutase [Bacteroidia bacterium]|nr:beta-phosphoglucomutase [Bacteroidia bacterium]
MITDKVKLYNLQNDSRLNLKAVFFDMDGVLFDSMAYHAQAWVYAMQTAGVPFTPYDVYMNEGRTGADTINTAFLDTFDREATEEECREIYRLKSAKFDEIGKQTPMANVYDLLKKIKAEGLSIYVVTGSAQRSLLDNLNHYFPDIFDNDRIVSAFDVTRGKPHPEPYLKALEKAKLQPFEAAVIENAPLGVESARAAGIFTIAVNTGILEEFVLESAGANAVFPNMEKLNRKWDEFYEYVM